MLQYFDEIELIMRAASLYDMPMPKDNKLPKHYNPNREIKTDSQDRNELCNCGSGKKYKKCCR